MAISLDEGRKIFVDARKEIHKLFVGYDDLITCIFLCLLSGSAKSSAHMLIIGKPGTGKTLLSSLVAGVFGVDYKRIDGNGELQPSDIVGYYDPRSDKVVRGPIFTNIAHVDEINRLSPRGARPALLAPMAEGLVTIDNTTYVLEPPFVVIATENPASYGDVAPLRAQERDRFLLSFFSGWPSLEEQVDIIDMNTRPGALQPKLLKVCSREQLLEVGELAATEIYVDPALHYQAAHITRQLTPEFSDIEEVSGEDRVIHDSSIVRGADGLIAAARSYAFLEGRDYVTPLDIERLSYFALPHRINAYSPEFGRAKRRDLIEQACRQAREKIAQGLPG